MSAATLFGPPLPPGGTIGVVAAASPYDARSEILRGVEWWEAQGYRAKLAGGVLERDDYVAGDAQQRAADLVSLFADDEVDVVHFHPRCPIAIDVCTTEDPSLRRTDATQSSRHRAACLLA